MPLGSKALFTSAWSISWCCQYTQALSALSCCTPRWNAALVKILFQAILGLARDVVACWCPFFHNLNSHNLPSATISDSHISLLSGWLHLSMQSWLVQCCCSDCLCWDWSSQTRDSFPQFHRCFKSFVDEYCFKSFCDCPFCSDFGSLHSSFSQVHFVHFCSLSKLSALKAVSALTGKSFQLNLLSSFCFWALCSPIYASVVIR